MNLHNQRQERLVVVFFMIAALFFPPILSLFDHDLTIAGVPLLLLYLFGAWAVVIGVLAAIIEHRRR